MSATITLKIEPSVKTRLIQQANKKNQNISQYIREILEQNLGLSEKSTNPFLKLVGTMDEQESEVMLKSIAKSRKSRNQSHWNNLANV